MYGGHEFADNGADRGLEALWTATQVAGATPEATEAPPGPPAQPPQAPGWPEGLPVDPEGGDREAGGDAQDPQLPKASDLDDRRLQGARSLHKAMENKDQVHLRLTGWKPVASKPRQAELHFVICERDPKQALSARGRPWVSWAASLQDFHGPAVLVKSRCVCAATRLIACEAVVIPWDRQAVCIHESLIDAEVVQPHECEHERGAPIKPYCERSPEDTPATHQNPKGALDGHAIGGLVVVEVVVLRQPGWANHGGARAERRVPVDEVRGGQITGGDALAERRHGPRE